MGGTFNDEMIAANERARAQRGVSAAAVPASQPRRADPPAAPPAPARPTRRLGGTVVSMMVVFAVMVLFASALGGLFETRGSDGSTVAISSDPVMEMDDAGAPVVSWDAGGFAFDTPEGWSVDTAYEAGVVRVLTADGDLIEILDAARWTSGADPLDHAFDTAYGLYLDRIGFVDELSGVSYDSPYADASIAVQGETGRVAVMVGPDGTAWAAVDHRVPGALEAESWESLLTSLRPS